MSSDDNGGEGPQSQPPTTPAPARAPRSRKSAKARLHPVADPDAWRDAVLPDPEPTSSDEEDRS